MVDYMRKDWLLYNFRVRGSDPANVHKVVFKGAG